MNIEGTIPFSNHTEKNVNQHVFSGEHDGRIKRFMIYISYDLPIKIRNISYITTIPLKSH